MRQAAHQHGGRLSRGMGAVVVRLQMRNGDARNALQRFGDRFVRKYADILSRDRIDDGFRVLLERLRALEARRGIPSPRWSRPRCCPSSSAHRPPRLQRGTPEEKHSPSVRPCDRQNCNHTSSHSSRAVRLFAVALFNSVFGRRLPAPFDRKRSHARTASFRKRRFHPCVALDVALPPGEADAVVLPAVRAAKPGIGYPARTHCSPFPSAPCVSVFGQALMTFPSIIGDAMTFRDRAA